MSGYILRRLAAIGALAFGITLLVFLIIRLIPGDPAVVMLGTNAGDPALIERLHQQLGLDRSISGAIPGLARQRAARRFRLLLRAAAIGRLADRREHAGHDRS